MSEDFILRGVGRGKCERVHYALHLGGIIDFLRAIALRSEVTAVGSRHIEMLAYARTGVG